MSATELDPEIVAARSQQAACLVAVDFTTLPAQEGRAAANAAAMFFNDGLPQLREVRDLCIPAPGGPMRARLYRPVAEAAGVVLYAHGGGWFHCNVDTHDRLMRSLAVQTGLAVLGIDYRLAPEHPFPAALRDMRAAWTWLRGNAERSPNRSRLAIAGDSAGANLALATALSLRDDGQCMPQALALFYGCYAPDFATGSHRKLGDGRFGLTTARMRWYWQNYLAGEISAPPALAAPLRAHLAGLPRVYLNLAELDPISDDTRALAERLSSAAVAHELVTWPATGHGFLQMTRDVAVAREALDHAAAFLVSALT